MNDRVEMGIVAAVALAMAPEHMVYDLRVIHTCIKRRPDTIPIDNKPNKFALKAIEKALQKRAMRNAKRLKQRDRSDHRR